MTMSLNDLYSKKQTDMVTSVFDAEFVITEVGVDILHAI